MVEIVDSDSGRSVALRPSQIRVEPGQGLLFVNNTSYDIDLAIEDGDGKKPSLESIFPYSSTRVNFRKPGESRYVLYFSSNRNSGKISGTIMVEGPEPPAPPPSSEPATSEPVII